MKNALSINDFCERYDVGRTYAYQELAAGRLHAHKAGRRTIIPVAEAERWLRSLPAYSASLEAVA